MNVIASYMKLYTVLQSKRGKLLKFFTLYSKVLLSFYLHIETIYVIVIARMLGIYGSKPTHM